MANQKQKHIFILEKFISLKRKLIRQKFFTQKELRANIDFPLNYAGMVRLNVLDGNDSEVEKNESRQLIWVRIILKYYIVLSDAYSHIKNYDTAMKFLDHALKIKINDADIYIARLAKFI